MFYYSKLAQIALVGPGIHPRNGQRDNFTRGPPCLLRACLATQSAWNHLSPLFSFRGLPLPTFQLNDARMGASAEENGSKKHLQSDDFTRFVLVHSLEQTTTVTCVTWQFSLSPQFLKPAEYFYFIFIYGEIKWFRQFIAKKSLKK